MLASLKPTTYRRGAVLFVVFAATLAGCGRTAPAVGGGGRSEVHRAASNESAYHLAPAVDGVDRDAGRVAIVGRAQPGSAVRLATPDGRVVSVVASAAGRWRIELTPSSDLRLFSVSALDGGRAVQSEGYLAVAPDLAAQLRAGSGALVYGAVAEAPRILAIDYDGKGGCVISGVAGSGRVVSVRIDGAERGRARADASGRFSLALDEPVASGPHDIAIADGGQTAGERVDITPADPMPAIPLRAERLGAGWRVDWTTPGGGVQTTLLFPPRRPSGDPA